MRHTVLIALCVLSARAATIPQTVEKDFEKKLDDVVQEVLSKDDVKVDVAHSEELEAQAVKDVENNLKNGQIANIPVEVVLEDVKPVVKSDKEDDKEKDNNEVIPERETSESSSEIKRVEIDLNNPGEPQRQEHDTQSPEHFEDDQKRLSGVKQGAVDAETGLNGAVVGFQQNMQSWWKNNQQIAYVQNSLIDLQNNFQAQVDKFNQTIQEYWRPENGDTPPADKPSVLTNVESGLKTLESGLRSGVQSLADGIKAVSSVKQDQTGTQGGGGFGSGWNQMVQNFQTSVQEALQNWSSQFNNGNSPFGNNDNANGTQVVDASTNVVNENSQNTQSEDNGTTQKPGGFWQNIQSNFNNIFNQNNPNVQQDSPQPAPSRPIIEAFQSVLGITRPPVQAVTQKPEPAKPNEPKPEATQEGTNAVPDKKPEEQQKEPVPQQVQPVPPNQSGPIKQFLGKNPVVQGLAGAVQRIQHTIVPEKPRDVEKEEQKGTKYGFGGGKPPGARDNNNSDDSRVEAKPEPEKEKPEVPKQEPVKEVVKEEVKTPEVHDKTD